MNKKFIERYNSEAHEVKFMGKIVADMERDELIAAVVHLGKLYTAKLNENIGWHKVQETISEYDIYA